jgi:hypothetical protein
MPPTKIAPSEAAVLTVLAEQPDMPEKSYLDLIGNLKSLTSKKLAVGIRQESPVLVEESTKEASQVGAKAPKRQPSGSGPGRSLKKIRQLYWEG